MFQRLLIPLNGSVFAERALSIAAPIARASGGSIILTRVINKSNGFWPSMAPQLLARRNMTADLAESEQYLATVSATPELENILTKRIVRFGPTVSTLLTLAALSDVDLIVLCSHNHTDTARQGVGSIAEQLLQKASIPVLIGVFAR